jgi:hypothetical protein
MSIPLENLDDKTYDELVRDALARIPIYAPRWTDRNETDPGVTFIELFAWLEDMQIYSLNRIDDRSRLKFLKLLGVPRPYPPRPAEVYITFELNGDSPISIPKGTRASLNSKTRDQICFETVNEVHLSPSSRIATVHAVQGMEKKNEFQSDGSANLKIEMKDKMVLQSTETVENMLKVCVHGAKWAYKEDLDGAGVNDSHFMADLENGTITFGDGIHGKIPSKGYSIIVEYRSGVGSQGNIGPKAINKVLNEDLASKVIVYNESAAYGGEDAETLESAIGRARKDLREVTRAVTSADYEYLALACPDVSLARAKALEMYHPSHDDRVPTVVSVVIVPKSTDLLAIPAEMQISKVREHLEKYRLMGTELFVLSPEYVHVKVETEVVKDPRYLDDSVKDKVKDALAGFLKFTEGGGPDGGGWPFGRPVYLSEVIQVIDGAEGVDHVKSCQLCRWVEEREDPWVESKGKILIPAHSLVYSKREDHAVNILPGDE